MEQAPHAVLMVRPAAFGFNTETAATNGFQQVETSNSTSLNQTAQEEFDGFVARLRKQDIRVIVVNDTAYPIKPDAIFPNNWFSTHADGKVIFYPMLTPNRQAEVRSDVLELLQAEGFEVNAFVDWSDQVAQQVYLEGTGSVVFDHRNKVAYAAISPRTDNQAFEALSSELGYQAMAFDALDLKGNAIYHTNVFMHIGTGYCMYCPDAVADGFQHAMLKQKLSSGGLTLIPMTFPQMNAFVGNMLEVLNEKGKRHLILSETAMQALRPEQKATLSQFVELLPVAIPTIEKISGGSARCMLAGIHLPIVSA